MIKKLKTILLFIILIAFGGIATDVSSNLIDDSTAAMVKHELKQYDLNSAKLPHLPAAELGGVSMELGHIAKFRTMRTNFGRCLFSNKVIAQRLAEKDAVISKHVERTLYPLAFCNDNPSCDYYVFALRHIII